jgi:cold shock protein
VRNVTSRAMRKLDPDVFEVSGSVKWFDPAKGYGFILPDEHLPDILLHVSCLRRGGFQTAYEGSRIICDVVRTPKGLQAARIRGMDNSTAIRPAQLPQRTTLSFSHRATGKKRW